MIFNFKKITASSPGNKAKASVPTFVAALIGATPLCGYLFTCGCTWPGLGLDSACNFHHPQSLHKCPWCASSAAGILSLGFAFLTGVGASTYPLFGFKRSGPFALIIQFLSGISVFVLVAMITAIMSAYAQEYSL